MGTLVVVAAGTAVAFAVKLYACVAMGAPIGMQAVVGTAGTAVVATAGTAVGVITWTAVVVTTGTVVAATTGTVVLVAMQVA